MRPSAPRSSILGRQRHPVPQCVRRAVDHDGPTTERDHAAVSSVGAGQQARELGSPGAAKPRDADHLSRVQLEVDRPQHPAASYTGGAVQRRADRIHTMGAAL